MSTEDDQTGAALPRDTVDDAPKRSVPRRPLLKALGLAGVLTVGSKLAAADRPAPAVGGSWPATDEIHPNFGFASPTDEPPPQALQPDHVVEMHHLFPPGLIPEEQPDSPDNERNGPETDDIPPEFDHPPFFHFDPTGLHIRPGDIVQFTFDSPDHTVTAYHPGFGFQQRIPDGVPPFSSPIAPVDGYWLYQFDEPGLYDLYCAPHQVFGMVMRLVVGDIDEPELPPYTFDYEPAEPMVEAPFSREAVTMFINLFRDEECEWPFVTPVEWFETEALDPMNLQERGTVDFATVAQELGYDVEPH